MDTDNELFSNEDGTAIAWAVKMLNGAADLANGMHAAKIILAAAAVTARARFPKANSVVRRSRDEWADFTLAKPTNAQHARMFGIALAKLEAFCEDAEEWAAKVYPSQVWRDLGGTSFSEDDEVCRDRGIKRPGDIHARAPKQTLAYERARLASLQKDGRRVGMTIPMPDSYLGPVELGVEDALDRTQTELRIAQLEQQWVAAQEAGVRAYCERRPMSLRGRLRTITFIELVLDGASNTQIWQSCRNNDTLTMPAVATAKHEMLQRLREEPQMREAWRLAHELQDARRDIETLDAGRAPAPDLDEDDRAGLPDESDYRPRVAAPDRMRDDDEAGGPCDEAA